MDTKNPRKVYIKDINGSTLLVGEAAYKGQVIHTCSFGGIGTILSEFDRFEPKEDDVWILAYPKCGTHWVSEIAGIIASGELKPVKEVKETFMVDLQDSLSVIENIPSPRIINTHLQPKYLPESVLKQSKIICVIRNPKSSAVSYYHHCRYLKETYEYTGEFSGFLSLFKDGIDDISGSWYDFTLGSWDLQRQQKNVLFVFYEDLLKDAFAEVKAIGKFLGAEKDDAFYEGVVELASFSNMSKSIGKDMTSKWHIGQSDSTGTNQHFRKGKVTPKDVCIRG